MLLTWAKNIFWSDPWLDVYVKHGGYMETADTNNIVGLFPQAVASLLLPQNPAGCWDWWGYDDGLLLTAKVASISFNVFTISIFSLCLIVFQQPRVDPKWKQSSTWFKTLRNCTTMTAMCKKVFMSKKHHCVHVYCMAGTVWLQASVNTKLLKDERVEYWRLGWQCISSCYHQRFKVNCVALNHQRNIGTWGLPTKVI